MNLEVRPGDPAASVADAAAGTVVPLSAHDTYNSPSGARVEGLGFGVWGLGLGFLRGFRVLGDLHFFWKPRIFGSLGRLGKCRPSPLSSTLQSHSKPHANIFWGGTVLSSGRPDEDNFFVALPSTPSRKVPL